MPPTPSPLPLRRILLLDAATCAAMGAALALASGPVARLTRLPEPLLLGAGLALLPVAGVMALVALRRPGGLAAWLVVLGNALWVAASLALLLGPVAPNALGVAFVLLQAAAVAGLAWVEALALRGGAARPAWGRAARAGGAR